MIGYRVIEAKRDGAELDGGVLSDFLRGFMTGEVTDYQMSAFLMAVFFRGLSPAELDVLVDVMIHSGMVLEGGGGAGPRVDKHSTGGVGDKVSLVLAPLAAELGLVVPMMSGRGLGHTGGTLDKLEAIPGFRTDLPLERFHSVLAAQGFAMIGQTDEIAPLDRRLYALRSVTATVSSLPLIAASIMSKKLAEGLTGLVLDIKVGSGAFLPEPERGRALAETMVRLGRARGVTTVARITAMDRPLGLAIGNALEVKEAVLCLRGGGPPDLREVTLALAAEMMAVGGVPGDLTALVARAAAALDGGRPLERLLAVVGLQGGDPSSLDAPEGLPQAPIVRPLAAESTGWVSRVVPELLGYGVIELGGGRRRLGDAVDPRVGFELQVKPGDSVREGTPLGLVHAADEAGARRGLAILRRAVDVSGDEPGAGMPLLGERIGPGFPQPSKG